MNIKIPDEFRVDSKIPIKEFVPKTLKPEQKKRIKNSIKSVVITHQIAGTKIPSYVDSNNRCEVIQFFDIEVGNIKDAPFLANIYQSVIKSPCIIHFFDAVSEAYSFGLKRLSQQDENEIVVEYAFITRAYDKVLSNPQKKNLLNALSFENIKGKTNKLHFHNEMFVKAYIIHNDVAYKKSLELLAKNLWYDMNKISILYSVYKGLVGQRYMLTKVYTISEKVPYNQQIKESIIALDKILEEN